MLDMEKEAATTLHYLSGGKEESAHDNTQHGEPSVTQPPPIAPIDTKTNKH